MTPMTMTDTLRNTLKSGFATPSAHPEIRTATGVVACRSGQRLCTDTFIAPTNLEHLDEGNRKIEIGKVAKDQAQTEACANGDNSSHVHLGSHLNLVASIKKVGPSGHELCHDSCHGQVVRCQDDRIPLREVSPQP